MNLKETEKRAGKQGRKREREKPSAQQGAHSNQHSPIAKEASSNEKSWPLKLWCDQQLQTRQIQEKPNGLRLVTIEPPTKPIRKSNFMFAVNGQHIHQVVRIPSVALAVQYNRHEDARAVDEIIPVVGRDECKPNAKRLWIACRCSYIRPHIYTLRARTGICLFCISLMAELVRLAMGRCGAAVCDWVCKFFSWLAQPSTTPDIIRYAEYRRTHLGEQGDTRQPSWASRGHISVRLSFAFTPRLIFGHMQSCRSWQASHVQLPGFCVCRKECNSPC